jgi:predicted acylesterase/phospholipase RssA
MNIPSFLGLPEWREAPFAGRQKTILDQITDQLLQIPHIVTDSRQTYADNSVEDIDSPRWRLLRISKNLENIGELNPNIPRTWMEMSDAELSEPGSKAQRTVMQIQCSLGRLAVHSRISGTGMTQEYAHDLATAILDLSLRPKLNLNSMIRFMYATQLIACLAPSESQRNMAHRSFLAWQGKLLL